MGFLPSSYVFKYFLVILCPVPKNSSISSSLGSTSAGDWFPRLLLMVAYSLVHLTVKLWARICLRLICPQNQRLSTCSSQTSITSITWELVRNAHCRASHPWPPTVNEKSEAQKPISNKSSRRFWCTRSARITDLERICVCLYKEQGGAADDHLTLQVWA